MKIIAEIGSNFKGFEQAKDSISIAKNCGADAVKFQLFSEKALYGQGSEEPSLPLDWLPKLKDKAQAVGIEFMVTAFSPEYADAVNPYVDCHKIASSDLSHVSLLEKINSFKKPVYLSTGASGIPDIEMALSYLQDCRVTLMFCVAEYPARYINFEGLKKLKNFGLQVGFSDHSIDVAVIANHAKDLGAVAFEKHVDFFDSKHSPDAAFALSREDFKHYCISLRGDAGLPTWASEHDMRVMHNRRLVATKNIKPGEVIHLGINCEACRVKSPDMKGLSPFVYRELKSQNRLMTAHQAIQAGQPISPDLFSTSQN